jgi:Ser/Thr protein kinase RdoA (MazF antagonist)
MESAPGLERWLSRTYGLVEPAVTAWDARTAVDLVRVRAGVDGAEAYWLRICSRARVAPAELEEEAAATAALAREAGLAAAIAAAVPTVDGGYVGTWPDAGVPSPIDEPTPSGAPTLLFREVPGVCVEAPSPLQAANLGALVADVHVAGSRRAVHGSGISVPDRSRAVRRIEPGAQAERALDHVAVHLRACGVDDTEVRAIAVGLRAALEQAPLPAGFVHGDLHLENVRFDGDRPALLDFACAGDGPFVYDLACYWRKRLLAQDDDTPPADWSSFVDGYASVRVPSAAELGAIPALACLRAIWVMCLPALPSEGWGADWLGDPGYFAAHIAMIRRFARLAVSASAATA